MTFAVRQLTGAPIPFLAEASEPAPGITTGGLLWFEDLSVADPTAICPLVLGALHLINVEVCLRSFRLLKQTNNYVTQSSPQKFQVILQNMGRFTSFLIIPIAAYAPAGLLLYWITSAAYTLFSNLILSLIYKPRKHLD